MRIKGRSEKYFGKEDTRNIKQKKIIFKNLTIKNWSFRRIIFFLKNLNISYPSKMAPLGVFFDPRVPNSLFYRFFKISDLKFEFFMFFYTFCQIFVLFVSFISCPYLLYLAKDLLFLSILRTIFAFIVSKPVWNWHWFKTTEVKAVQLKKKTEKGHASIVKKALLTQ